MNESTLRLLAFYVGCLLTGGCGLYLLLWTALHPPDLLPKRVLEMSGPRIFLHYFLFPGIGTAIGLILILAVWLAPY